MILECPLCRTRYLVPANSFAAGPRTVRCARCKHSWKAELPNQIDAVGTVPEAETTPAPERAAPLPPGSNLPVVPETPLEKLWNRIRWVVLALFILMTVLWLIFDRQEVAHRWRFLTPVYDIFHLSVSYPGEELEFDEVHSELKFDGGITRLFLDGKVRNKTKNSQKVPNIVAEALGADGQVIQSWQIDAPTATLAAGEEAGFSSSINAPKGNVVNVNLTFAEMKDE